MVGVASKQPVPASVAALTITFPIVVLAVAGQAAKAGPKRQESGWSLVQNAISGNCDALTNSTGRETQKRREN
jgi:hypothetical protein